MEYTQLTLNDWIQMKEDIRRKLQETAENFVYIGYKLRQIEELESYRQDGVASIYEFAEKEYGLTRTVTQRFMAINAKFSVEGNSVELLPQYKEFGSSKLQEMLNLSDEDCKLLTAKATVKEIRELKAFNRQQDYEEDTGENSQEEKKKAEIEYTNLQKCIIDFFSRKEKRETLNAVMQMALENEPTEEITRQQAELINPAEFNSHMKGVIYLFMYEYDRGVAYKSLITNIITKWSWQDFIAETVKIYSDSYGPDTWCNFYGPIVDTVEVKKEEKEPAKPQNTESEPCATSHKKEEKTAENEMSEVEEMDAKSERKEICAEETEWKPEDDRQQSIHSPHEHSGRECTSVEGTVKNPYYELQDEAKELADLISHTMFRYEHMPIPVADIDMLVENIHKLEAVIGQMILLTASEELN